MWSGRSTGTSGFGRWPQLFPDLFFGLKWPDLAELQSTMPLTKLSSKQTRRSHLALARVGILQDLKAS